MRQKSRKDAAPVGGRKKKATKKKKDYTPLVTAMLLSEGYRLPTYELRFAKDGLGFTGVEKDGRQWRFDIAYEKEKIAIELHGVGSSPMCRVCKVRRPGGHHSIQGYRGDRVKMNEAAILGWIVIEVCLPEHLNDGSLLSWIRRAFELRKQNHLHDLEVSQ